MGAAHEPFRLFGVALIGITPETGRKLLLTLAFVVAIVVVGWLLRQALRLIGHVLDSERLRFWGQQATSLAMAVLLVLGLVSIWFEDTGRLATVTGLLSAGIAVALQRVITAFAGYFVILRGKTFNVGDRIVMGGVRGDVIALSFIQTKIMEMGQPPPEQEADPAMWIHSRQFSGRIVTITNDKIFDEPVYNYSYHFPYIWEELRLPIHYTDDRAAAETILLEAARRHAITGDRVDAGALESLEKRYNLKISDVEPTVYWRLTDNWLELSVRFLAPDHGTRTIKDAMAREILARFDEAGIGIGSSTLEITAFPPVRLAPAEAPPPG